MLRSRTRQQRADRQARVADKLAAWRALGVSELLATPMTKARRTPIGRRETPRRSDRVRDPAYLAWVHTLTCAASHLPGHRCDGPIEADHVGVRPLGRKCSDVGGVIALCMLGHRQRTDHCGPFRDFDRAAMRRWVAEQLRITADAWRRHTAASAAQPITAGAAGIEAST